MSIITIIKIVLLLIICALFVVTNIQSYAKGYDDCIEDFNAFITDAMERKE